MELLEPLPVPSAFYQQNALIFTCYGLLTSPCNISTDLVDPKQLPRSSRPLHALSVPPSLVEPSLSQSPPPPLVSLDFTLRGKKEFDLEDEATILTSC
jgi:hypothetical protein